MKTIISTIIFSLILGVVKAQVSFFVSPDLYLKMSFNSNSLFHWDTKTIRVSEYFTYENQNYSLVNPIKLGGSMGVKIKNKHEITFGLHTDGVSDKTYLRFPSYQQPPGHIGEISKGEIMHKFTNNQTRFFLNYKYAFIYKPNKFSLSIMPSFGLATRPGAKGSNSIENIGSNDMLTQGGLLNKEGVRYNHSITTYDSPTSNKVFVYGIGLNSDFYSKDKYLFSVSLQFSHARTYLSSAITKMEIVDPNTNDSNRYSFESYQRTSGLYLGFSRKILLFSKNNK